MTGRLNDKAVVITGAARGLGEAYARAAAEEGAALVLNDIDAELLESVGAELGAVVHPGDIGDPAVAASLIARCEAEFGRIDGLVNNAGTLVIQPIEDQDPASFRHQIEANLMGTAWCGLAALPRMIAQGHGSVVNTTSGAQSGSAFRCAYSAASAGIAGLTGAWAAECAGSGVRVNAVAPIAMTREFDDTEPVMRRLIAAGRIGGDFARLRETMQQATPAMNAPLVVFLLSDISAGVNGQTLRLNDGKLHLVSRPAARSPMLARDRWTVEDIAAAFAEEWQDKLLPFGMIEFQMTQA